ncbi:chromate transporter [Fusibacter bizertensis]|jgi:Chromate transport protein ChrA|uniref:Chromate transporter n=1 Tax=Fusibacter bizertensis TaxID=1488331 RepID=A0ABT6N9J8_9FIRM|nr:chromate transporter [Fusibacter bizertensis]MDH8677074.1 chromate transporter [Fusibacter bizertensis]
MKVFKKLLKLYIAFFKVGLLTIGGGYAMLPIIEQELVKGLELLTMDEVVESYTLSQTLPGVIASNAAALIGYRLGKVKGAVVSVLGVITPSIIIILFIAMIFTRIEHLEIVQNAFKGIRVVVLALLFDSFSRLFKVAVFDRKTFVIASVAFILVLFSIINPILVIVAGGFAGVAIYRERVSE